MTSKTIGVVLGIVAATALGSACSAETRTVDLGERGGSSSGFGAAEAGADAGADAGDASTSRLLCATSECPAGTTTCESSRTRCDIDLMSDRNNCGACGAACDPDSFFVKRGPPGPYLEVVFLCASGKCEMACTNGHADCDGIPDNGCEIPLDTTDNCGACGLKCPGNEPCTKGVCGCPPPEINCNGSCVNPTTDTGNCGACDHLCEDPSPPSWDFHHYMQCNSPTPGANGVCGRQCEPRYGDCDQDLETNGCEQRLNDNNHCGACDNACPSGTQCMLLDDTWQCGCPPGLRACPFYDGLECLDILSDPNNCGGCGVTCQSGQGVNAVVSTSAAVCRGGVCGLLCKSGRADCNGSSGDGCEVDLQTNPLHCGACGHECDLALGQPCVKGECVVTECSEGETR